MQSGVNLPLLLNAGKFTSNYTPSHPKTQFICIQKYISHLLMGIYITKKYFAFINIRMTTLKNVTILIIPPN
jgi:hypothetical protein